MLSSVLVVGVVKSAVSWPLTREWLSAEEFFPEAPPARAAYAVNGLPKSARVEIECVAHVPN